MRRPWAFLDRSKGHLEFNFDQHAKEAKRRGCIFEQSLKACCFSMVFEGPEDSFWMTLGVLSGSSWGSLGGLGGLLDALWLSWRRVGGGLGVLGNAKERLTMLACV